MLESLNDTPRLRRSMKSINTFFRNHKIENMEIPFDVKCDSFSLEMEKLEKHIQDLIKNYLANPIDETLVSIFNHIQFWGGTMGRMYYIHNKNNRLINEHLVIYKEIISCMIAAKNDTLCGDIDKIIIEFEKVRGIGISFGTKHLRFWSISANKNGVEFPILDSVIAINRFTPNYLKWSNYCQYVMLMQKEALKRKITITDLERHYFNEIN